MYLDAVWWLRMFIEGATVLIGVPGNALIIRVYAAKRNKVTPHVFIIGLAVADLSVCVLQVINILQLFPPIDTLAATNEFFCRVPKAIDSWARYTSIVLTSTVALDRYFAICQPHAQGRRMNVRRAQQAVVACFVVSMCFTLPYLFMYGLKTYETGDTSCVFVAENWIITTQFFIMLVSIASSLILVVVVCAKVYAKIRKMSKVRPGAMLQRSAGNDANVPSRDDSTARAEHCSSPRRTVFSVNRRVDFDAPPPVTGIGDRTQDQEPRVHGVQRSSSPGDLPLLDPPTLSEMPGGYCARDKPQPTTHDDQNTPTLHRDGDVTTDTPASNAPQGVKPQDPKPTFHRKTTMMLLLATVVFVITLTPLCLVILLYSFILPHLAKNEALRFVVNIATYSPLVNHAGNPILYSFINRRFRGEMMSVLRGLCRCKQDCCPH